MVEVAKSPGTSAKPSAHEQVLGVLGDPDPSVVILWPRAERGQSEPGVVGFRLEPSIFALTVRLRYL